MAINISTLFADIIDTPEQRQQKLLQQGMAQGQLLASGLTGRARALAPLAQMAGQLGVQRNEDLRRAVQPMLGIDPRTRGERLEEQLSNIDTSTPDGLLQAAQAIQSIDPMRASTLRQAAAEQRVVNQNRERQSELDEIKLQAAKDQSSDAEAARKVREVNASNYAAIGVSSAFIEEYKAGALSAAQMAELVEKRRAAIAKGGVRLKSFTSGTEDKAKLRIDESDAAQALLNIRNEPQGWYQAITGGERAFSAQDIIDEAAIIWSLNEDTMDYRDAVDLAVETIPRGGYRSILGTQGANTVQALAQGLPNPNQGQVNTQSLAAATGAASPADTQDAGFNSEVQRMVAAAQALRGGAAPPVATPAAGEVEPTVEAIQRNMISPTTSSAGFDTSVLPQARGTNENMLANSRLGSAVSGLWEKLNNPEMFEQERAARAAEAAMTPQQKREQAKASDYLDAVANLDFPALPTLAKGIQELPNIARAASATVSGLANRLAAEDGIKDEAQKVFDAALNTTANLVGSLVEGQSTSRESGERLLMRVELAQSNIAEMQRELGKLPPSVRSPVASNLAALKELLISYKKRYNLPTP